MLVGGDRATTMRSILTVCNLCKMESSYAGFKDF